MDASDKSGSFAAPLPGAEGFDPFTSRDGWHGGVQEIQQEVQRAASWVPSLQTEMARVIVGQRHLVDRLLVGLLTNGHVLLEGVPGLAKTLALKTLAGRLWSAPVSAHPVHARHAARGHRRHDDLQPARRQLRRPSTARSSPTSSSPTKSTARRPRCRARCSRRCRSARSPSATRPIALPEPFLVMATQNPIEQEGTYPLPEAQVDRFMLKVDRRLSDRVEERAILDAMATSEPPTATSSRSCRSSAARWRAPASSIEIYVDDKVRDYIVDIVSATRDPERYELDARRLHASSAPRRAPRSPSRSRRARWAFLHGRGYVTPQDVKALAPDVLRHRVAVSYEAEAENITSDDDRATRSSQPWCRARERSSEPSRRTDMQRDPEQGAPDRNPHPPARQRRARRRRTTRVFNGRGMDFDEVREYVPGDEVRTIDWNVTARAGRPFVKKFARSASSRSCFVVDVSASGDFGSASREQARAGGGAGLRARVLGHPQQRQGRPGAVHRPDRAVHPAAKGRAHVLRVVREIARLSSPSGAAPTSRARSTSSTRSPAGAPWSFVISDFQIAGDQARRWRRCAAAPRCSRAARSRRAAHRATRASGAAGRRPAHARGRRDRRARRDRHRAAA